jgi:2-polyprenyl-3-methyl-5-hydroxy-6-metoxy-1,4-benzoquinol methylase
MRCPVCFTENPARFKALLLLKYHVSFFSCDSCGFVHTEEPVWLPEAYKEAYNDEDTFVMQRNLHMAKVVPSILFSFFSPKGRFLDFAGGHGIFTRLMRDQGFDFFWQDAYAKNIFCRGFEFSEEKRPVELITAIECFEHFPRPLEEIESMLVRSTNIFFTTDLLPSPVPSPDQWYYYALTHGQHISFYSRRTLLFLAKKFGFNVCSNGFNYHLFTKKNISDARFKKALRPGFYFLGKIRKAIKSRTQIDHDGIVDKKTIRAARTQREI